MQEVCKRNCLLMFCCSFFVVCLCVCASTRPTLTWRRPSTVATAATRCFCTRAPPFARIAGWSTPKPVVPPPPVWVRRPVSAAVYCCLLLSTTAYCRLLRVDATRLLILLYVCCCCCSLLFVVVVCVVCPCSARWKWWCLHHDSIHVPQHV